MLEQPSQSPELNLIEKVGQDLKIDVFECSPLNLTELKLDHK